MGAWKGLYMALEDREEKQQADRIMDLREREEERIREASNQNLELKRIQSLFKFLPDIKGRKTKVSLNGNTAKDLQKYFTPEFLAPLIATNNPKVLQDLYTAATLTHNKRVEQGADANNIDQKVFGDLYANLNILEGKDPDIYRQQIMQRSIELGISPETWKKYPSIYNRLLSQIEVESQGTVNVEPLYTTPIAKLTDVNSAIKIIQEESKSYLDVINTSLANLMTTETAGKLPPGFDKFLSSYSSKINEITSATQATQLGFTGGGDLNSLFGDRSNITNDPTVKSLITNANKIAGNTVIDMLGTQQADGSYEYWSNKNAMSQTKEGTNYGINNPYKNLRVYYEKFGIKLIPENTIIKVLLESVDPRGPGTKRFYTPTRTRMRYD